MKQGSLLHESCCSNGQPLATRKASLWLSFFRCALIIFILQGAFVISASAQTLTTDHYDYPPGSTVTFTGCGFQAGESVSVQVVHYDGTVDANPLHQPWYVTANSSGCFVTTWCVCEPNALGMSFIATAIGQTSGLTAQVVFSDAITGGAAELGSFGVDGDLYANKLQFGYFHYNTSPNWVGPPSSSLNGPWTDSTGISNQSGSDDYFKSPSYPGLGIGVIDTLGAAAFRALAIANNSAAHEFRMAYPPFTIVHGPAPTAGPPDAFPPVMLLDAVAARDGLTPDPGVFLGSNKNGDDPSTWQAGPQNVQAKDDIVDAGGHIRVDLINGHLLGYAFASRLSTNGDSHVDFEIFRSNLTYTGTGFINFGPDAGHTAGHLDPTDGHVTQPGDVILLTDYTNGGGVPNPTVAVWVDPTHLAGPSGPAFSIAQFNALPPANRPFSFTGVTFAGPAPYVYAAITTKTPTTIPPVYQRENDIPLTSGGTFNTKATPWGNFGATSPDSIKQIQLVEVAIDFSLLGLDIAPQNGPCANIFGTLMIKTRSSQSFQATLEDFAGPFLFGAFTTITVHAHGDTTITCAHPTATVCATAASSSQGPISYCWQGPGSPTGPCLSTDSCFSTSTAGKYYITVNVNNGCTETDSITITGNTTPPAANCSNNGPITCINTTRTVSVNACDGAANRTYAWTGPAGFTSTSQCPVVSAAGTYTVTVTNTVNGCTATCSTTLQANTTPPPANCSNNGPITCINTTRTISVNSCDGAANTSYAWTGPAGFTSTSQCPVVSAAGTYTVTVTNTVNGCTATCSTTLQANTTPPPANCSNNGPITCTNTTRTISVNSCVVAANTSYAWTGPAGFTSTSQCPVVSAAGTYTVTVTNTVNGCTATCSTTLQANITPPPANCSNNGPITCTNPTRTISVNSCDGAANTSYAWTGPAGFTSTSQCPVVGTAGTYTVTVTNTVNGCTATCSTTLTGSNTPPPANCSNNGPITCINTTRTISVNSCDGAANTSYAWTGPAGFTSTSQCPVVSTAGTYTVTVTNTVNGCTATCSTTLQANITPPPANCSNNGPITCINTTRTISVNSCDGAANTSYAWTGPAGFTSTSQCPVVSTAGTYTVTVTNTVNGCTATCSTTLQANITPPPANCSNNGPITCTNPTRTISVNSCDGAANTSYAWTGPAGFTSTSQCPVVSTAGTYTVTVTNTVNGCTATCSTTLQANITPPPANCSNNGPITCINTTRTISVNSCDGAANTSYAWTGPAGFTSTSQCPVVSTAGTYTVTVTNTVNGCTATCSTTLQANTTPPPANCSNNGPITCINTTRTISVNSCDGAANTSYAWTGPAGFTSTSQCPVVSTAGTYTVTVTNTVNGCTATCSTTLQANITPPPANCSNNGPITCINTTRTISVNSCDGAANTSYAWTGPAGFTSTSQCPVVSTAGTYTVTVTNTVNGCTATCSTTLQANTTPPPANCSNNGPITCTNPTRTISVNSCDGAANTSYAWTGPAGFTSTSQCPVVSAAGTYTVTVTNTVNGCTATCSTTLASNITPPPANCSNNGPITCINTTRTISVNSCVVAANTSYAWTGPAGFTSTSQCPVVSTAGTYTVTVTNTVNGCTATCSTTLQANITPPPANCSNNGPITCINTTRTISVNSCDGAANTSYAWTGPAGFTSTSQCPVVSTAGTYTVTVTNTVNGCTATCSTTLQANITPPPANCSNNGPITCTNPTRTISVNSCDGAANTSYAWTGPAGFTSTSQCPVVSTAGTYTVTVTNTVNGCTATCSTTLQANITPPPANCSNNGPITCINTTRTISVNSCDGAANTSYAWTGPAGFTSTSQCPVVSTAGTYTVTVTNTVNGCTATCSTTLQANTTPPPANCSNNGPITCINTTRTISVNSCDGAANTSYAWTGPAGFTSTSQCPVVSTAGTYTVTVTNTVNGCTATCSTTLQANITPPPANCSNNGPITCINTTRTISVNSCDGAANTSYAWTGPAGFTSTSQCPVVSTAGTYTVTVTNTVNGCTATCSTTLQANITPPPANCSNNGPITCTNPTRTISVNSCDGAANRTYAWTGPAGFTSTSQCPVVSTAGTYTVTVTNTVNGCTATCSTTLQADITPPPANCSNNGPITCINTTRTVSVNACDGAANRTYAWTGPAGFTSTSQCPVVSTAGTYTVTVTNTVNGCTATCSTTLQANITPPPANCSNNGPITCTNPTRTISVNSCDGAANTSYAWTGPAGFTSTSQCPVVSTAGTYTVTVTNTVNGCTATCSTTLQANITPPPANCSNNGPITCTNTTRTISVNSCDGAANRTYAWTGPAGFTSTSQCPVVSAAGTYTVTVTSTVNGCTATCSTTLQADITPPPANCSNNGPITCTNPTRTVSVNACDGAANRSYAWSGPGGFTSTSQCPTVITAGTYTVTVTNTVNGCTATCSTTVASNLTHPTCNLVAPNPRPFCGSAGNTLCANATNADTYHWTILSGALWAITAGADSNCIVYSAGSSDSVTIQLVVRNNASGCSDSCTVTFGCQTPYWGCTLGFWKNHSQLFDQATDPIAQCVANGIAAMGVGYSGNGTANSSFMTTFGLTPAQMTAAGLSTSLTLLQALNLGGGGFKMMARQGVASLLNTCGLSGNFFYNTAQVITMMHNAVVTMNPGPTGSSFAQHNETLPDNCPPGGPATHPSLRHGIIANDDVTISAYPNPFNSKANIDFEFSNSISKVTVEVFTLNGQKIATLFSSNVDAGTEYKVELDGSQLAPGIYIYKINTGDNVYYDKLILMK